MILEQKFRSEHISIGRIDMDVFSLEDDDCANLFITQLDNKDGKSCQNSAILSEEGNF